MAVCSGDRLMVLRLWLRQHTHAYIHMLDEFIVTVLQRGRQTPLHGTITLTLTLTLVVFQEPQSRCLIRIKICPPYFTMLSDACPRTSQQISSPKRELIVKRFWRFLAPCTAGNNWKIQNWPSVTVKMARLMMYFKSSESCHGHGHGYGQFIR